jgi:ubiquinone/menaquinone biosynthesis C-methylase UbiE
MSWDSVWEEIFSSRPWGKYPSEDVIRFVARNYYQVLNRDSVQILEVGCGTGANLWYVAREGFAAYGIDGSSTALRICRDRMDAEVPGWKGALTTGDVCNLAWEDEFFDAVIDNECIYANQYDDARKIYKEIHRVLKPGGKLFSKTFASGSEGDGTGTKVGHNAWLAAKGPLAGKGVSRFTAESEFDGLLTPLKIVSIERVSRSEANRSAEVAEWVINAEKRTGDL